MAQASNIVLQVQSREKQGKTAGDHSKQISEEWNQENVGKFFIFNESFSISCEQKLKQSFSDKGSDRGLDPQELIDLHEVLLLTLHFPTLPLYSVVLKWNISDILVKCQGLNGVKWQETWQYIGGYVCLGTYSDSFMSHDTQKTYKTALINIINS